MHFFKYSNELLKFLRLSLKAFDSSETKSLNAIMESLSRIPILLESSPNSLKIVLPKISSLK